MKAFRLKGTFHMRPDDQPFRIEVVAEDEQAATEYTYSVLGSRHRARRDQIHIWRVTELSPDEVTDPTVAEILEGGAAGGDGPAASAAPASSPAEPAPASGGAPAQEEE